MNGKISQVHGLEDSIVKMAILLKLFYRFSAISVKIPAEFLAETEKPILKNSKAIEGQGKLVEIQSLKLVGLPDYETLWAMTGGCH